MNWSFIVSGILAVFCTVGHFIMGGKLFLKPMMEASFDDVPKKVMHCVFHFISVDFILATLLLLSAGFGISLGLNLRPLIVFVAIHFALYAIVQVLMVRSSGIEGGLKKIFQWSLFSLVALFAFIGVL